MGSRFIFTLVLALQTLLTAAAPTPQGSTGVTYQQTASSSYWLANIKRQGTVAFGSDASYKVFRNVKDYGAKGDGSTDDTTAINSAISDGNRCGKGCDSSTVTPALVYFPPGTYMVSKPIIQYYYTQFVGDAIDIPVLKATASFQGMAVIDADPYNDDGSNWFTNQNNFFRQVRNFVIDLTGMPATAGAGIHWQVAQATSLQNIRFEMVKGGDNNKQQGIFMDNGSGGWMTDLTFNGGNYGAFLGNQQFTTRNLTFNDCNTAIFMNWNWAWTFKSVSINNCKVGIDMATGALSTAGKSLNQTVGSLMLLDSKLTNTPIGVNTSFSTSDNTPTSGGTLILDNVDFTGSTTAVQDYTGTSVLAGGSIVKSWYQGKTYSGATAGTSVRGNLTPPNKPQALMGSSGAIFERSKPQYENVPSSSFISVKSKGAKGDGTTDDTAAIQAAMNSIQPDQILYFDHGAYLITRSIMVPSKIKMTGEIWPLILASGEYFADQTNPKALFDVGEEGQEGAVEMSDMIFGVAGPAPGATLMRWNLGGEAGTNGIWDVHFRVGGYAGSQLQSDTCSKSPKSDHSTVNTKCEGAFLLFHATNTSSVYLENSWFWVADHELDLSDHNQIDIYNGRGVLIESQGAVWMYGTSAEHSVLYNYQLNGAKNVFMGLIQTETPYFQSNPIATTPFKVQAARGDPTFENCQGDKTCEKAWGLRVVDSSDVLIYGAGLYSFFDNYDQTCVAGQNCQANMVSMEGSISNLNLFGLSTKASVNMVTSAVGVGGNATGKYSSLNLVPDEDNRSNFCATIALWTPPDLS
ncbi:glucan 1,3-beta-glucosidase [Rhizodiscina lignyota]|uniref:Glucan 1,3-beta-glucosidase n=1 Tax=Rhizodiscina lignyota TaxID=1504668 RepID=A0A9P4MBF5_9PEZI|nr:glucan 1,3-beta-glucosidase [Rhizodiscina lignyota]